MLKFKNFFPKKTSVLGMVHVGALPGTPKFQGSIDNIVSKACKETEIYLNNNIDGLIVENMHDVPYIQSKNLGPEIIATLTRIGTELRKLVPETKPFGLQILAAGNMEAVAVAKACNLNFIRAEGFIFSHVADEGFIDANAGLLLRYRKHIEADDVLVFTDIKKKHSSHAITSDLSLSETAKAAEFFLSDGLIVTGTSTGDPVNVNELNDLKSCTTLPVLVGSGVTVENMENYISADVLIVGSYFKHNGKWNGELDGTRVRVFTEKLKLLQN